jgi:hypothetical protein
MRILNFYPYLRRNRISMLPKPSEKFASSLSGKDLIFPTDSIFFFALIVFVDAQVPERRTCYGIMRYMQFVGHICLQSGLE